jgi:hypothetical protein
VYCTVQSVADELPALSDKGFAQLNFSPAGVATKKTYACGKVTAPQ